MIKLESIEDYTVTERENLTKCFLNEVYYEFRRVGLKWAKLTKQTSFFPKGYLGQNLVSIITGIPGTGSAARGDDLIDGSEVKTCARVDQLNSCKKCKTRIASYLDSCPKCNSLEIEVMVDSHWICPVDTANYKKYREEMPKIYFLLVDDDDLDSKKYLARFTVWSITPATNKKWQDEYVDPYYHNYQIKINQKKKPAPMNVHPKTPKFEDVNPDKIFESTIAIDGFVEILQFPK